MPQDNQWNYEDGVVRGASICRTDNPAKALDALRHLTPSKVENPRYISPTCSCGCPHCC